MTLRHRVIGQALGSLPGAALLAWSLRADDVWFEAHTTRGYCAESLPQIARWHAARWIVAALGVLMLVVVRPRVARWLARRPFANGLGTMLRVLIAAVLAVVVTDGFLRWSRGRAAARSPAAPGPLTPNHAGRQELDTVVANRRVHYATNADGFRTRTPEDVVDRQAATILFSGESVVFGYGVDYDDTIPALVAAKTGFASANLAMSGAANDETLSRLERYLPTFAHPVAVVTFVVYDWIYRAIGHHRNRLALGWDGTLRQVPPEPTLLWTSPIFGALRAIYHAEDAGELTRAILRRTSEIVRSRGAYPLFVFTQSRSFCVATTPKGPALLRRLADDQPFSSLEVNLDPSLSIEGDVHPNPRGTAYYAELITDALKSSGVLPPR